MSKQEPAGGLVAWRWARHAAGAGLLVAVTLIAGCRQPAAVPVTPPGEPPKAAAKAEPGDAKKAEVKAPPDDTTPSGSVFFPDKKLSHLEAEAVDLASTDPGEQVEAVLGALLQGPTEPAHGRVVPRKTKLNKVKVSGSEATIDLSKAFVSDFTGGSNVAGLAVYSVVNSACSVAGIKTVRILIDGQPGSDYGGTVDLSKPLEPDPKLEGGAPLGSQKVEPGGANEAKHLD